MKSAGEILAPALRRALPRRSAFEWMTTAWPAIVGKQLAQRTSPKSLIDGVLRISVNDKEWFAGIQGAQFVSEFCNRINLAWGGALIREVHFLEAQPRGPWIPKAADNSYTPFVRRRSAEIGPKRAGTDSEPPKPQKSPAKEPRQ
jgi:Dna[CI] antecedent, DciA